MNYLVVVCASIQFICSIHFLVVAAMFPCLVPTASFAYQPAPRVGVSFSRESWLQEFIAHENKYAESEDADQLQVFFTAYL